MLGVNLAGQRVHLLPQRALWWPVGRTVFIADVHLGKASTFRARGLPIQADLCTAIARHDLERLSAILDETGAGRLVILGDLLHAPEAHDPALLDTVALWRAAHPARSLEITLVRGNHDVRAGDPPAEWGIRTTAEGLREGPFACYHHPELVPETVTGGGDTYGLAGHIHPGFTLSSGPTTERVACFWLRPHVGVLPAFGRFTGTARIRPGAEDRLFAVGASSVLPIPTVRPGAPGGV